MTLTASRFLDPRAGVVFKKVFGEHANLLAGFLNAVMPQLPPQVQQPMALPVMTTPNQPAWMTPGW